MNRRAALATIAAVPLAGLLGSSAIAAPALREIYRWDQKGRGGIVTRVRMHDLRLGDCFAAHDGEQWRWYDAADDPTPMDGPEVCQIIGVERTGD